MDRKKLLFLIFGAQVSGLGTSLRAMDSDAKGTDDLAGNIASAAGQILTSAGTDNLKGLRAALELNIRISQEFLDNNPA